VWTLEALIRFWTAVVLRAPKALTQALADSLEGRWVRAAPEPVAVDHRADHRRRRRFCRARRHWESLVHVQGGRRFTELS
jgi:hypothetical protein